MGRLRSEDPQKVKFLDGFRFLLAFWVVTAHFYTLIGGTKFLRLPKVLLVSFNNPVIAVYGFMIITGFLMSYNYLIRKDKEPWNCKETIINFWLRRLFRLYPVYILLMSFAYINFVGLAKLNEQNLLFFTGTNITQGGFVRSVEAPALQDFVAHLFLVHGLFPSFHDSILGVTWSLSLEMQFYFVFPFLFLYAFSSDYNLKNRLIMLFLALSVMAILAPKIFTSLTDYWGTRDFRLPSVLFYNITLFILGMVSAAVKLRKCKPIYLTIILALILPFQLLLTDALILMFLLFLFMDEMQSVMPMFLFKILDKFRSILSCGLARFGADISYSLYLIHTLLIGAVLQIVIKSTINWNPSKLTVAIFAFFLLVVICASICWLIFHLIEKPFIEVGKKVGKRITAIKPADCVVREDNRPA